MGRKRRGKREEECGKKLLGRGWDKEHDLAHFGRHEDKEQSHGSKKKKALAPRCSQKNRGALTARRMIRCRPFQGLYHVAWATHPAVNGGVFVSMRPGIGYLSMVWRMATMRKCSVPRGRFRTPGRLVVQTTMSSHKSLWLGEGLHFASVSWPN